MGFSPLMGALKAPRLLACDRLKPQSVDPAVDKMRQSGAGVFDELCIGWTLGSFGSVAPPCNPIPLPSGIPIVKPHLDDGSGWAGLLEAGEEAGVAIFTGFNFDDHTCDVKRNS
jgi:hypothetical protein